MLTNKKAKVIMQGKYYYECLLYMMSASFGIYSKQNFLQNKVKVQGNRKVRGKR